MLLRKEPCFKRYPGYALGIIWQFMIKLLNVLLVAMCMIPPSILNRSGKVPDARIDSFNHQPCCSKKARRFILGPFFFNLIA